MTYHSNSVFEDTIDNREGTKCSLSFSKKNVNYYKLLFSILSFIIIFIFSFSPLNKEKKST